MKKLVTRREAMGVLGGAVSGWASLAAPRHAVGRAGHAAPSPATRRRIDIRCFCGVSATRYDVSRPFRVRGWDYATDGRVCVRVPAGSTGLKTADLADPEGRVPPFESMPWNVPRGGLWRRWPDWRRLHPRLRGVTDWGPCPVCNGECRVGRQVRECPRCYGFGCEECGELGLVGGRLCDYCEGGGQIDRWVVRMGGGLEILGYYARLVGQLPRVRWQRQIGRVQPHASYCDEWIAFRFAGGGQGALATLARD